MARSVLVPVDDTDISAETLEYAFSEYPDASFTALHVLSTSSQAESFVGEGVERADVDATADALRDRTQETAAEYGVDCEFVETTGSPPQAIVEYAETGEYDLIAMGTHGRQGTERMLAGSVAEVVIRTSPVPVLVYR